MTDPSTAPEAQTIARLQRIAEAVAQSPAAPTRSVVRRRWIVALSLGVLVTAVAIPLFGHFQVGQRTPAAFAVPVVLALLGSALSIAAAWYRTAGRSGLWFAWLGVVGLMLVVVVPGWRPTQASALTVGFFAMNRLCLETLVALAIPLTVAVGFAAFRSDPVGSATRPILLASISASVAAAMAYAQCEWFDHSHLWIGHILPAMGVIGIGAILMKWLSFVPTPAVPTPAERPAKRQHPSEPL